MNTQQLVSRLLPYFIGTLVIAMLASLGMWQIVRGVEKRAGVDAYAADGGFTRYYAGMETRPFQMLRMSGQFEADRQILLDNMVADGRNGHFVMTPFRSGEGTLLVNRGWVARAETDALRTTIEVTDEPLVIHGRVGQLPRAGMRMGDAFEGSDEWPRHAVYPKLDEVEQLLQADLMPFVLLLDPQDRFGFRREWEPEEMSASRHFGYAFQRFAMAAMLSGLLVYYYRKRTRA